MGYYSNSPMRAASGAVVSASPRIRSERHSSHGSQILAPGLMLSMVTACLADDLSQTLTTRETLRQQEREQPLQSPVPRAESERLPTGEFLSFNHDLGGGEPGRHRTCSYSAHYSLPFSNWLLSLSGGKRRYYQSAPGQTNIYSSESHNGEIQFRCLIHREATSKTSASLSGGPGHEFYLGIGPAPPAKLSSACASVEPCPTCAAATKDLPGISSPAGRSANPKASRLPSASSVLVSTGLHEVDHALSRL